MSNEEIKTLMRTLTWHVNKATEIVKKINANSIEERNNNNYDAPRVLSVMVRILGSDPTNLEPRVHVTNTLEILGEPVKTVVRDSDVYETEQSVHVENVKFFELK